MKEIVFYYILCTSLLLFISCESDTTEQIKTKTFIGYYPDGAYYDRGHSVVETSDNHLVAVGYGKSTSIADLKIIKTDADGDLVDGFPKSIPFNPYNLPSFDVGRCVIETHDNELMIVGYAVPSEGSSYEDSSQASKIVLVKINREGDPIAGFPKYYGKNVSQKANQIINTSDGGFAFIGFTKRSDSLESKRVDIYFGRTDSDGNMLEGFPKFYGGESDDIGDALVQMPDGGFAIAGHTYTKDGLGDRDAILIRTDEQGNILSGFPKLYGTEEMDEFYSMVLTSEGDLAMTGTSRIRERTPTDNQRKWIYLLRTDANGDILSGFPKHLRGFQGRSITQTRDGGFAISGSAYTGGNTSDVCVLRTDGNGNIKTGFPVFFKGDAQERGYNEIGDTIIETDDNGLVIATALGRDDFYFLDFALIKTDANGLVDDNH